MGMFESKNEKLYTAKDTLQDVQVMIVGMIK